MQLVLTLITFKRSGKSNLTNIHFEKPTLNKVSETCIHTNVDIICTYTRYITQANVNVCLII